MTKPKHGERVLPKVYRPGYLAQLDRRTELFQRLHGNFLNIADDLGGQPELSHIKSSLIERYVFLEAVLHKIESDLANNPDAAPELLGRWIQAVNSLTGLAKTLGIERRANDPLNSYYTLVAQAEPAVQANGHANGHTEADLSKQGDSDA